MKKLIVIINFLFICLHIDAQTELWGMTIGGGQYGAGTIFKTDGSGNNLTVEHSFYCIEGANPGRTKLIQATDGMLYGTTTGGGSKNLGTIYQFDPGSNVYTKKHEFTLTANGKSPIGSLLQATDGKLYGVASGGTVTPGAGIYGVLYQYDLITNTYAKKIDFGPAMGSLPTGSLLQYADGNIYGMTAGGGVNNFGVIFQYNPVSGIYTKKIDFDGVLNGRSPKGELMQAADGKLYGMTALGGVNNKGIIFQYDPITNVIIKKFDFDGTANGSTPYATLTQATNGMLYGMTYEGG
ncbi:MAG: choice-of-anchor tandem repeat GloVer-containing protein, partial [Bacteroidota bacterium]